MNSNFYIPQTPALKSIVHAIWQTEGLPEFGHETILPKGVVEVIFDFGEARIAPAALNGKVYTLTPCFINGFNTRPISFRLPRCQYYFGVQFQPVAIKQVFGVPASEFADRIIDLTLVEPGFSLVWEQLAGKASFDERVASIAEWAERKALGVQPRERLLNYFLTGNHHETLNVTEAAARLCYSTRQLSRTMQELTGMNAEEVLLYRKFIHATQLMHSDGLSLTAIAHQCGFTDQSHFIRSFKRYSGLTPGAYRRYKTRLPGHIYDIVR